VAITDVRIIVGKGAVIPSGTIIVRAASSSLPAQVEPARKNLKIIKASGMSAMRDSLMPTGTLIPGPTRKS
jgi:hypothetical protein